MQFPVPQFTDVEDHIIGPLTLKQFLIVFGVGMLIFLGYSLTKSVIVAIFFFLVFGVPGLGLAFAPFNGRPIYNSIGYIVKFWGSPKLMVFHKEAIHKKSGQTDKQTQKAMMAQSVEAPKPMTVADTKENLRKVQELLRNTAIQEETMLENRDKNKTL